MKMIEKISPLILVKLDSGDSATAAAAATTPVKLVKPVAESSANQTQPRRMTAAQLFTTSEVSKASVDKLHY